jgi:hypothetical protein
MQYENKTRSGTCYFGVQADAIQAVRLIAPSKKPKILKKASP